MKGWTRSRLLKEPHLSGKPQFRQFKCNGCVEHYGPEKRMPSPTRLPDYCDCATEHRARERREEDKYQMRKALAMTVFAALALFPLGLGAQDAQDQSQTQVQTVPSDNARTPDGTVAVFKITVVGRTVKAINYRNRESTEIGFEGTSLLSKAEGKATVENKRG